MIAIGIDIGGTSIKGAGITTEGKVISLFSMPIIKGEAGEVTVKNLIELTKDYIEKEGFKKEEILGIGIGIPGSIDSVNGVVDYSNNLKWNHLPIVEMFEKELSIPVKITNDANAATLGEAKFGAGKEFKNIIMITLGTGVGGGIIINGKLYEGASGKGAEIGHMMLKMGGKKCSCGRHGCYEAYASATALIAQTKVLMKRDRKSIMWEMCDFSLDKVDGKTAFEASKQGDKTAKKVVDNYVKYLSEGLLDIFNIFRPDALILSGGIANQGEYLTSKVIAYCEKKHYGYKDSPKVEILISRLGYDSGKIGAAALFIK